MSLAGRLLGGVLLTVGVLYLGFLVDRTDFYSLCSAFTAAFAGYYVLIRSRVDDKTLRYLIGLGIALRLALVFAFPLLSDDVYRFLWDGQLIVNGYHPFAELPAHYLQSGNQVIGLTPELFGHLNSPDYYTIYPPVAQGVFTAAVWVSPGSWYGASVVMKVFLFVAELGTLWLLGRLLLQFGLPRFHLLYYWLNPLIVVEVVGNLHFEGPMVCFLLGSLYLLTRSSYGGAAGAMALSVASKLLPLMLLPFLLRRLWRGQFWRYALVFGMTTLLLFAPLLLGSGFLSGFGSSLGLYFQKFEFNASLYYLLRWYGYYDTGWNQIARFGPLLAQLAAVGILFLAYLDRRTDWRSLPVSWFWAFLLYLLCATTVHPWYLGVPIALTCFTRYRFVLLWSFLITFTYTNYTEVPYRENNWLVLGEYVAVGLYLMYEYRWAPKKKGPWY